jgi:glycosyltransferase involved in cell wall biosynthesis
MRFPRVLQLISSGGVYGAENMVLELTLKMTKAGCDARIGVFDNEHRPNLQLARMAAKEGLNVEVFKCRGQVDSGTIRNLRQFLLRQGIDVLHTHGYKANTYGLLAARGTEVKRVATAHNWPGKTMRLRAYAFLDHLQLRCFDHVCAVSTEVRRSLRRALIPKSSISVVPNGISCEKFASGDAVLTRDPRLQGAILVGYVGRLAPEKGLHGLLVAAKGVVHSNPSVRFVFCGQGPSRNELSELARKLGIGANIVFLGQRFDLPDIYASLDVFVLPSLCEGMPMALLEAMAAKKAIVASRVGGIPSLVESGTNGLLVQPNSVEELESVLLRLVSNPDERRKLGEAAHTAVQRFSASRMAEKYLEIYAGVLCKARASALAVES